MFLCLMSLNTIVAYNYAVIAFAIAAQQKYQHFETAPVSTLHLLLLLLLRPVITIIMA